MNKTLINPAPTLSSNAPAKGASNIKKSTDSSMLPNPIAEMITTKFLATKTRMEVSTKPIVRIRINQAEIDTGALHFAQMIIISTKTAD